MRSERGYAGLHAAGSQHVGEQACSTRCDRSASPDTGDHDLHESFDVNDPHRFTREDLAWLNAFFSELTQLFRSRSAGVL